MRDPILSSRASAASVHQGWSVSACRFHFHPFLKYRPAKKTALNLFYRPDWQWSNGETTWVSKPAYLNYTELPHAATDLPKPNERTVSEPEGPAHWWPDPAQLDPNWVKELSATKCCRVCGRRECDDGMRWYTVMLCSRCVRSN
jgi:hypothetical protein